MKTFSKCISSFFLWSSLGVSIALLSANIFLTASAQSNLENIDYTNLHIKYEDKLEDRNAKIEYQLQRNLEAPGTGEVSILIDLKGGYNEFSKALKQHGFRAHRTYGNLVQGRASADDVEKIAGLSFVNFVREPLRPVYFDIVSEGVDILQANIAHSIEQTGKGAKVAVIDGGFDITNPEISANIVEAKSFRSDGSIKGDNPHHGTACAEIVVDIAPDVELYLFTVEYSLDFVNAVNYAVSKDVDIISISLGFHNAGPYDGRSHVSRVLEDARNSGVLPVVAVGNDARKHWSGVFQDPDSDDWLNFAGSDQTNSFSLHQDEKVEIYLSWNDWWHSDQDYDLFLYRDVNGSLIEVAKSITPQSGFHFPTESISYTASISGTYHIAIYKSDASGDAEFDLFTHRGGPLEYQVPSGSIANVADAKGAVAVGALYWANNALEPFSSRGPTADGRIKPDIVAPDGVQTTAYSTSFYGTSASTPHVAGLAALLVGSSPSITSDEIAEVLENTAVDMGESGKDNLYGSGRAETKYSTLDVSPRIVSIIFDGKEFPPSLLPRTFLVDGKPHPVSLSATSVAETDTRYVFKRWSDGNTSPSVNILFDGSWQTRLAQFSIQYLLTIRTDYGTPSGDGWYDPGATASFSIPSTVDQGNRTRRVFTSWTGATTATTPSATVVMDSPKVVTALWKKQYELIILSSNLATTGQGWYDAGTLATFSVQPEIDHSNDTRRAFKYWSGDFTGSSTSGSVLMDYPKILEVVWRTQYLLRIDAPIQAGFEGGGWYDVGEAVSISGRNVWDLEPNRSRINLKSYDIDGETYGFSRSGSGVSTIKLEMNRPHSIKITGVPQYFFDVKGGSNLEFGTPSPTGDMWWDEGQSTTVSTDYVWNIVDSNTRLNLIAYLLDGRRYEVARANASRFTTSEIVIDRPRTLSFEGITQHLLHVVGGHQIRLTSSPTFDRWFDEGSIVAVSSRNLWETPQAGVREQLDHWQLDDGAIQEVPRSETGSFQTNGILMDRPHEIRFSYVTQYLLEVFSPFNTPVGGGWYDKGVTATIGIQPVSEYTNRTRHIFVSWSGDVSSEDPTTPIVMDSPKRVEADWKTQYYLIVQSMIGEGEGEGWYDRGKPASFKVTTPMEWNNKTRHIFVGWTGDVQLVSPEGSIIMLLPSLVEANWKTQYFLKVVSPYGNPQGEGWHDRGGQTTIQVSTLEDHGNMTRHVFTGWAGDIVAEENVLEVTVTEPIQVVANWKTQYYLDVDSAFGQPDGEGWYDRGTPASFNVLTPVDWGNQTRHVFVKWTGDVESDTPEGSILMSSPRKVSARWKTQYLISLIFTDSSEQEELEPSSVELIDEAGRHILLKEYEELWFDRGSYSIGEISWMNVDVRDPETSVLAVSRPGEVRISTETYSLTLTVRDLVSLPVQDVKITTRFANGTSTVARTDGDGVVEYSLIPLGDYSADVEVLGFGYRQIGDASLHPEVTVTVLLSIPTIILLVAVAVSALGGVLSVRRRSGRWPLGVRPGKAGSSI